MPSNPLFDALLAVQSEAPALKKTAENPHFRSKFAPLDHIVETINPILAKHKLVWSTLPTHNEYGPALTYKLAHAPSGEVLEGTMPLLLSKQDAQGQGSAITYARRYALCAVLNLVAEDDDDGQRAAQSAGERASGVNGRAGKPTDKQVELIHKLVKQKGLKSGQLYTMLAAIGADNVEIREGWASSLTGGREGQASALIDLLMNGPIPEATDASVPESDVPEAEAGEFVHPPEPEGTFQ